MAYKGVLDDIRTCIKLGIPKNLPIFGLSHLVDATAAGYYYEEVMNDGKKLTNAVIKGIEKYDWDWGFCPIDDAVTLEPLGFETGLKMNGKGRLPHQVVRHKPATSETLTNLRIPDFVKESRAKLMLDALKTAKTVYGDTICNTGSLPGPFILISEVFGASNMLLLIYDNPRLLHDTISFFEDFCIAFVDAQIDSGIDAVFFHDLLASSCFMSKEHYEKFGLAAHMKIVKHIHKRGLPIFFHPNESRIDHLLLMSKLREVSDIAISVGSQESIIKAKAAMGDIICLMGNVHCLEILRNGSKKCVEEVVKKIIDNVSIKGGHILTSCAAMAWDTPPENIITMVKTAREYFKKKKNL